MGKHKTTRDIHSTNADAHYYRRYDYLLGSPKVNKHPFRRAIMSRLTIGQTFTEEPSSFYLDVIPSSILQVLSPPNPCDTRCSQKALCESHREKEW